MRTLAALLFCLAFTAGFSQNLDSGLILFYPFNGNFHDTSVNQLHGITNATLTEDPFGRENSAIHFNGNDQYLDFPPVNPILKPNLPVSFAFWIRFELESPFVSLIFTTDYAQDIHSGAWVSTTWDGALNCGFGDGTGNGPYNRRSFECTTILESKQWYYVIAIISGRQNMSLYLDCMQEEGTFSGYGESMGYTDCQGGLGRKDQGVGYPPMYFYGAIDDFRYWDRALTPEEIDSLCFNVNVPENPVTGQNDILLFPNPATGMVNLSNLPDDVSVIELFDSVGKLITVYDRVEQIRVSDFSPGIYSLRFLDNQQTIIARKRFVKE
jgi:hypothetical protein